MTIDATTRRDLFKTGLGLSTAAALATALPNPAEAAGNGFWTAEYWAQKGTTKLYLYRKRLKAPSAGEKPSPVLFLVHGSSLSSRASYDMTPRGLGEYSLMNVFAGWGYDVWTMDFDGYGHSGSSGGNSDIASGVEDLKAASELIERETRQKKFHFLGESSGAIRAAAFAQARPDRTDRLVLVAFTYTGKGAPTLGERAKQLDYYRSHNRRPRDLAMIKSIFTRDKPGTSDPRLGDAIAGYELQFGNTVPTGTYLDMTANLPVVDPTKVRSPIQLLRGEYDGIATEEDLLDFLRLLPHQDKQYGVIPGAAHSLAFALNRKAFWHVAHAFLDMPPTTEV